MSAARWLLDSNAVMGYLNGDVAPGFAEAIERCLGEGAAVSVITLIEVLGWRGHTAQSRIDAERLLRRLTPCQAIGRWLFSGSFGSQATSGSGLMPASSSLRDITWSSGALTDSTHASRPAA